MLVIRRDLVEEIMMHAREEDPHEACGIIAGPESTERPERFIRMTNAAKPSDDEIADERRREELAQRRGSHDSYEGHERTSRTEYGFDSREWFRVTRDMDSRDEWPVVMYHSHTPRGATPSDYDVDNMTGPASDPRVHYVIVSTWEGATPTVEGHEFRSFHIVDGVVAEEEVSVVESYMFAHTGADDVPDRG